MQRFVAGGIAVGLGVLAILGVFYLWPQADQPNDAGQQAEVGDTRNDGLRPVQILYPFDESVFPPEIAAPTFSWKDNTSQIDSCAFSWISPTGNRIWNTQVDRGSGSRRAPIGKRSRDARSRREFD